MSNHEILCVSGFFSESECHLIGKEVITCHGKIRHMERTHNYVCKRKTAGKEKARRSLGSMKHEVMELQES